MKEELEKLLEELNISGNEAKIYIACLELGPTTITKIARKAEVERTTVYATLERLREKGLVSGPIKEYSRQIQVESPEKLLVLARQKKKAIESKENQFKEILPDLLASVIQRGKQPKVRFYEGKEQFIQVFDQALDETKEKMFFFGAASIFVDLISYQFEKEWIKRRVRKKIHIDILVHKTPLTAQFKKDEIKEMRTTKFLSQDMKFEASFLLWSNKIVLWNPVVPLAIAIEDEIIAKMFSEMFLGLWQKAK